MAVRVKMLRAGGDWALQQEINKFLEITTAEVIGVSISPMNDKGGGLVACITLKDKQ